MSRRKHPSLETKLAAMTVLFFQIPYLDAKKMTKQQVNSLVQWDHNILHETEHPDRDKYWNLTPRLIREHREKTKQDLKVIAKGRRIRAKLVSGMMALYDSAVRSERKHRLRSRGFDKTKTRRMDGTVTERKNSRSPRCSKS